MIRYVAAWVDSWLMPNCGMGCWENKRVIRTFKMFGFTFAVHRACHEKGYAVTEISTGQSVGGMDFVRPSIRDAVRYAKGYLEQKGEKATIAAVKRKKEQMAGLNNKDSQ